MIALSALIKSNRAAAAVEMALVTPLLLIIMMGSFELGNYFLDEHAVIKGVRDGARFAGRQSFTNFDCSAGNTTPGGTVVADTRNVVKTGLPSGGTARLPGTPTITVTLACYTTAGGQTFSGIYTGAPNGAPVVTVSATWPYTPVMQSFGFRGTGLNLNATQQASVMGI